MTYQEFKLELLYNILQRETVNNKQVRLLEKSEVCTGLRMQDIHNCFAGGHLGRCKMIIGEDLLDVEWNEGKHRCNKQWDVREYYIRYLREGWQGVIPDIIFELDRISRLEDKNRLIIRSMNYKRNADKVQRGIYWRREDIALVLYEMIAEPDVDLISLQISRESLSGFNQPEETLMSNALLNTCSKMPPLLFLVTKGREDYDERGSCFLRGEGYDEQENDFLRGEGYGERRNGFLRGEGYGDMYVSKGCKRKDADLYRLTTTAGINGSLTVFYPRLQERLACLLGGDYYVSFPNIHDALIYPLTSCHVGSLKETTREKNAMIRKELVLTDKVYRYCGCRKYLLEV